ncbi:putative ATPase, AAA-type, core, P-loop containing nucleoside triphosphate hydrolase [Rosa chinensis]|uniref:Putative ATPase, AAA-type, core, P-loop containing nucleoside triphosphate hydrolase n=1 Tax=Rosa chinensis TaxID=74649 RepID=A0A2P6RX73_ROSCH|nr:putative ATPase, AAA-type, core, P-loop containing nucleoside triphosphate hydrolase [Rosa chinensis]
MANFLGYDVYDLDLSRVKDYSELKMLLLQTTSKSVILIEDLDQFFAEKSTAVSFSGISNFMDGLLNSCYAEERVMVFMMNSKDQVDLNFLRPGRIDVHIHFPFESEIAIEDLEPGALNCVGVAVRTESGGEGDRVWG